MKNVHSFLSSKFYNYPFLLIFLSFQSLQIKKGKRFLSFIRYPSLSFHFIKLKIKFARLEYIEEYPWNTFRISLFFFLQSETTERKRIYPNFPQRQSYTSFSIEIPNFHSTSSCSPLFLSPSLRLFPLSL